jgi:hypothetical protein
LRSLARPFVHVDCFRLQRFAPKCQSEDLDVRRDCGDNPFTMRSLGLLLVAFLGLAAVEGCSSDGSGSKASTLGTAGASGAAGATATGAGGAACNVAYCPTVMGATQCCLPDNSCGYNLGMGCLPFAKQDAGTH